MKRTKCGQEVKPLEVGDRVEAIGEVGVLSLLKGCCGIVRYVMNGTLSKRILVEFDKPITLGHSGAGACKDGHGWWGKHEEFKVIKAEKKAKK